MVTEENPVDIVKEYVNRIIKSDLLFSLFFGSYAYNNKIVTEDIDMIFVTKNPINKFVRENLIKEYLGLHSKFRLTPDRKYPGEYITERQLEKAENGWGFTMENGVVSIPEIRNGSEWNKFNDYRHHLTAVGGPTLFVSGDEESANKHKKKCLRTLATVVILNKSQETFTLESLVEKTIGTGKAFLGFPNLNSVQIYLRSNFIGLLTEMQEEGKIEIFNGQIIIKDKSFLNKLEKTIQEYNRHYSI